MRLLLPLALSLLTCPATAQANSPATATQAPSAPKLLDAARHDHFGTGIVEGKNTALADVLANADAHTGKVVRLEGTIHSICQTKGCWMLLGDAPQQVFVKFKDYAFFMPKDGAGRTAIVEGPLAMKQETVEQTRHYLEDAGKHDEAKLVTEGRKIFTVMASGVALQKTAAK
jgi:hypothetical protein